MAVSAWTHVSWAGPIAPSVADYNAADVRNASGVLTVPAMTAVYTATSTIPIGTSFIVTLPPGFTFGSTPALGTSGTATFILAGGGTMSSRSATFTVATANVTSGQTIFLQSYTVHGAIALATVTPLASALPITMQAVGIDVSPRSIPAFASSPGITAIFVGAIQFIDERPPSNATEFLSAPDTLTAVFGATAVQAETVDSTETVAVLGSTGLLNTISNSDTTAITIPGNFRGIARAFASTTSDCKTRIAGSSGTAGFGGITIPNVPVNREIFLCLTGSGAILGSDPNGFPSITAGPGTSTDFLSNLAVVEFPGIICYTAGSGCDPNFVPPPLVVPTPALSGWAMIGLAGIIVLFGAWKLKAIPATP
jgi:hypothetical protein